MLSRSASSRLFRFGLAAAGLVCVLAQPPAACAWGNKGHRMINRAAVLGLPADVPAFLRSPEALNEIEYLGPEPDRWRSPTEPELEAAQAPEHFINLEMADALGPLPHRRLDFEAKVFAAGLRPEKIGLQPWEATEVWERLKAALREYRKLAAAGQDFLCRMAGPLRGRRLAAAAHQHSIQRLGGSESPRLHHRPPNSLAVRGAVCGCESECPRGRDQDVDVATQSD
jgi:hypothetical protein